jgi:hypothetical protein
MCHSNGSLKYLDERPVTYEERKLVTAWAKDGKEGEMEERRRIG